MTEAAANTAAPTIAPARMIPLPAASEYAPMRISSIVWNASYAPPMSAPRTANNKVRINRDLHRRSLLIGGRFYRRSRRCGGQGPCRLAAAAGSTVVIRTQWDHIRSRLAGAPVRLNSPRYLPLRLAHAVAAKRLEFVYAAYLGGRG